MADSPITTPKRKRSQLFVDGIPHLNTTRFSFAVPPSSPEDGSNSPRTKVAHRFHGLSLESGGGVGATSPGCGHDAMQQDTDIGVRKRLKLPHVDARILGQNADGARPAATATIVDLSDSKTASAAHPVTVPPAAGTRDFETPPSTAVVAPSNNTIAIHPAAIQHREPPAAPGDGPRDDTQPRPTSPSQLSATKLRHNRKRITPPPSPPPAARAVDVVDPVRAALTWHEDEITIYDPDDSDDDGTGINGIGFKPTPAIAHARTLRRKQQLAEYRKREEREARARRSMMRRRGTSPGPQAAALADLKGRVERRRTVRFLECSQAGAVGTV